MKIHKIGGENLPLNNLKGELVRKGISQREVASYLATQTSTLNKKLNGHIPFTINEAFRIKNHFFPEFTVDYLFVNDS